MITIKNRFTYALGENSYLAPVVPLQEDLCFVTADCFHDQISSEEGTLDQLDWDRINPATGPVFLREAEPGDILKVDIRSIRCGTKGVMCVIPDQGVMGDEVRRGKVKILPLDEEFAYFNDFKIPLDPMIGVIGVAPAEGTASCGVPGEHGGNMDTKILRENTTLYLPVFQKGALLALGDLHACMGDGEVMVSGVEVSGEVILRLDVIKGASLSEPVAEDVDFLYTISSDVNLEKAIYRVVSSMQKFLQQWTGLEGSEAGMLMSACGDLQFSQVVDPKRTVRFAMPKAVLGESFPNGHLFQK